MPGFTEPVGRRARFRGVLSFAAGAALVAFVLTRLDYSAFIAHLASTHYGAYLAFALVFNLALVSADTLAIQYLYARTVYPFSYRELFLLRAASYLPSLLNYHVGQEIGRASC